MKQSEYYRNYKQRYKTNRLLKGNGNFNNIVVPINYKEDIDVSSKKIIEFIEKSNKKIN